MKTLIGLITMLLTAGLSAQTVRIESGDNCGSGVVIDQHTVITARHVRDGSNQLFVCTERVVPGQTKWIAPKADLLAITTTASLQTRSATISHRPLAVGDEVIGRGFKFHFGLIEIRRRVALVNPDLILLDGPVYSGMSGGGLWKNGQLVGIITGVNTDENGNALGTAEPIAKFR